jgi:hypothetical protein
MELLRNSATLENIKHFVRSLQDKNFANIENLKNAIKAIDTNDLQETLGNMITTLKNLVSNITSDSNEELIKFIADYQHIFHGGCKGRDCTNESCDNDEHVHVFTFTREVGTVLNLYVINTYKCYHYENCYNHASCLGRHKTRGINKDLWIERIKDGDVAGFCSVIETNKILCKHDLICRRRQTCQFYHSTHISNISKVSTSPPKKATTEFARKYEYDSSRYASASSHTIQSHRDSSHSKDWRKPATIMCINDGHCKFGDKCKFLHTFGNNSTP